MWVADDYGLRDSVGMAITVAVLTVAVALLMVSNIRYRSFKDLDLRNRVPFVAVLLLVLIFAFVSIDPPQVLFALFFGYAISGPINSLIFLRKRKQILRRRRQRSDEPN